jgi:hypothetical protein
MQSVYSAGNVVEGHILAGLLRSCGVSCHVGGHYLQGAVGEVAPTELVRLWVEDSDVAAARRILADYEAGLLSTGDADEP